MNYTVTRVLIKNDFKLVIVRSAMFVKKVTFMVSNINVKNVRIMCCAKIVSGKV